MQYLIKQTIFYDEYVDLYRAKEHIWRFIFVWNNTKDITVTAYYYLINL